MESCNCSTLGKILTKITNESKLSGDIQHYPFQNRFKKYVRILNQNIKQNLESKRCTFCEERFLKYLCGFNVLL